MGKIKTKKHTGKLHNPALSKTKREENDSHPDLSAVKASLIPPGSEFPTQGLFSLAATSSDTSQSQHALASPRDEDDRRSFISKKSIRGGQGQITKKEKMKLRHDKWLEKIDTIQMAKRNKKNAKKRSERPIIGDLNPLNQALPELSEIIALSHRKTQEANLEESTRFKQVLRHSAFKSNPFSTINEHLKNKLQEEQDAQR
ncbi:protein FAM207A-like isoform X2 [Acanthaster planci]|uniref:Protein FAM207A-like isoform X2 n=1 Tax=Acanthaster planci TaxID=133434 RepID=A0A8B7ZX34_ACAPL|nr:protein FAM207A-like isoform X2 [Acanthaster planci]